MTFNFLGPGLTVNVEAKVKEPIILASSVLLHETLFCYNKSVSLQVSRQTSCSTRRKYVNYGFGGRMSFHFFLLFRFSFSFKQRN